MRLEQGDSKGLTIFEKVSLAFISDSRGIEKIILYIIV